MAEEKEIWKDIPGCEGMYQVSSHARVRSLDRVVNGRGNSKYLVKGRILKLGTHPDGYPQVKIYLNKKPKTIKVHRLVAQVFIPNPENKPNINHRNGIKDDNSIDNLEWCTQSENVIHAFDIGLRCSKGEKHNNSKLTRKDVLEIRARSFIGESDSLLAKDFAVTSKAIYLIRTRKNWSHI